MENPERGNKTLGTSETIRVPFPAANTKALRFIMTKKPNLSFNYRHFNTFYEITLIENEDNKNGHEDHEGTSHEQGPVSRVKGLKISQPNGKCKFLMGIQNH